jgi:di/tripeptidase
MMVKTLLTLRKHYTFTSYFKDLLLYKGQTLITTDGTTLLGADDKLELPKLLPQWNS